MNQLTLIFDVVGSPKPHEVAHIHNQQAKKFLESMQGRVKVGPVPCLTPRVEDSRCRPMPRAVGRMRRLALPSAALTSISQSVSFCA